MFESPAQPEPAREWRVAWTMTGGSECAEESATSELIAWRSMAILMTRRRYHGSNMRVQHSDDGGKTWVDADAPEKQEK